MEEYIVVQTQALCCWALFIYSLLFTTTQRISFLLERNKNDLFAWEKNHMQIFLFMTIKPKLFHIFLITCNHIKGFSHNSTCSKNDMKCVHVFQDLFIWKGKDIERKTQRKERGLSFFYKFAPKLATMAMVKPVQSQELRASFRSPIWVIGVQALGLCSAKFS